MAAPEPASPSAPEDPARSNVVLVVEDEILIRLAIADHLRDAGLTVYEAASATEAVDLLSHYCRNIDAVFTDIMMPGSLDGLGLMSWISVNCPDVPVVVTSGAPDQSQTITSLRQAGVFFLKPYSMDKVAELLKAKAKARAQARDGTDTP